MQFTKANNIFYLILSIVQWIPIISPLDPFATIFPLVLVVLLSMAREAF